MVVSYKASCSTVVVSWHVSMCIIVLCHFITHVDSGNHHHSQDTELLPLTAPLCYPFVITSCMGRPQDCSPGLVIHRRTWRTPVLLVVLLQWKDDEGTRIDEGKQCIEQNLEDTRHELPKVISQWSWQNVFNPSAVNSSARCEIFCWESLRLRFQGFYRRLVT